MIESKGQLRAQADAVFSQYIRFIASDENGNVTCVTCGAQMSWKKATCGHFIPKRNPKLRYEIFNAHPQCRSCNDAHLKVLFPYLKYMVKRYGWKNTLSLFLLISPSIEFEYLIKYDILKTGNVYNKDFNKKTQKYYKSEKLKFKNLLQKAMYERYKDRWNGEKPKKEIAQHYR